MKENLRKVRSACERCRKQKLKCDVERPCTLCSRAGVECITPETGRWKAHQFPQRGIPSESGQSPSKRRRLRQPRREQIPSPEARSQTETGRAESHSSLNLRESDRSLGHGDSTGEAPWNASSTITLVEEAFHHHEAASPEETETSALLGSTWIHSKPTPSSQHHSEGAPSPLQRILSQHAQTPRINRMPQSSGPGKIKQELCSLLPKVEVAKELVEIYFTRIHWFTLLFHQDDFRKRFLDLYDSDLRQVTYSEECVGYVAVLLAVFATSLQYASRQQKRRLQSYGIEPEALTEKILAGLKLRFLDIVSLSSLEAVQMCILLGSYYLYHGEPQMAWTLCGSGLRIAQALNLHRKVPRNNDSNKSLEHNIEDRKRAWWAIYEIEVFCSMLYGLPLSISDHDCDVPPLDPYDEYSASILEERNATNTNLLFFKCAMSTLSAIVKSALDDLYGTRCKDIRYPDQTSRLKSLITKVSTLNTELAKWKSSLPPELNFDTTSPTNLSVDRSVSSPNMSKIEFEEHLFRLQALSLKLAYENARILVHRPLISFKMLPPSSTSHKNVVDPSDPFNMAIKSCRDAALQISQIGTTSYIQEASETYANAFISLHLLTAGVTLCISTSLDPLSWKAYESRIGIRRIMQMQSLLKDKSIIADQGLVITKRLMALVMAKEMDVMFDIKPPTEGPPGDELSNVDPDGSTANTVNQSAKETTQQSTDLGGAPCQPNIEVDTTGSPYNKQTDDFCENTFMAEAVMEYEQAITNPINTTIDYGSLPFDDQQDAFLGNCSLSQEQVWIWGWNFME